MITLKEVRYIAHLARLKLTDREEQEMACQLAQIIEYMDKLNELDTQDIPTTIHTTEIANVWQQDHPKDSLPLKEMWKNAPHHNNEFFIVPSPQLRK